LRGYRPEVIGRDTVKVGEGVVGTVARTHVPIIENDAHSAAQPLRGFGRMLGANAFVAIPILTKGTCIGVIVADNKTSGAGIQEDNIALLATFAGQAGLAIENAQLYEDREHRYQREIRLEAEMGRIRRLADIGQLAAKMAHEVRNPLSSIKGAAQLMRAEYSDIAPLCEFLDIIVDEVNALNMITTDLLDFARPMKLDIERVDLAALAERTLQLFETEISNQGVVAIIAADRDASAVDGDTKQLGQVMRNIILNAVQAMPEGGKLTISIGRGSSDDDVKMDFADTGVGVPEGRAEEIFQPFVTTKTKGTGLGLSIVRKIVENHAGRITVANNTEAGTTFTVTLAVRRTERAGIEEIRPFMRQQMAAALPDI
jgi:signal transduction histidine kinase